MKEAWELLSGPLWSAGIISIAMKSKGTRRKRSLRTASMSWLKITSLVENNIIEKATYKKDKSDSFFTFELKGCVHLPVEAWLKEEGVPAFVCPPINMILYKIRQLIDLAVEIADISVHQKEGKCVVRVVIFKQ
jgi:hypothetical protein